MDEFFGHVLDGYKEGRLAKEQVVGALAHVVGAVDLGNYDEARRWLRRGRQLIQE